MGRDLDMSKKCLYSENSEVSNLCRVPLRSPLELGLAVLELKGFTTKANGIGANAIFCPS